jgi:hypothetical protein
MSLSNGNKTFGGRAVPASDQGKKLFYEQANFFLGRTQQKGTAQQERAYMTFIGRDASAWKEKAEEFIAKLSM